MELSYWESRWRKNNTGFHMPDGYPGLRKHWNSLGLPESPEVLVPLCGKTPDMSWMMAQGAVITGVEIAIKAIEEFFLENNLQFETDRFASFNIYKAPDITIWQGDFLKLPKQKLPEFDLIYDKAALVALPPEKRPAYAKKLMELCSNNTSILLHHFIYNQNEMAGPPFSVSIEEVEKTFAGRFRITCLEKNQLDLSKFEKFKIRGLSSGLTEQLLYLTPL